MPGASMRDQISDFCPPWLQDDSPPTPDNPEGGVAGRLMYTFGLQLDVLLEKANQATYARFPLYCDASALPYLAHDRVMVQGPSEPTAAFRSRLQGAFPAWQHAGARRSVLGQIGAYLTGLVSSPNPSLPLVASVGGASARTWGWYTFEDVLSGPGEAYNTPSSVWDWDALEATRWWRNWLVLFIRPTAVAGLSGSAASITTATTVSSGQFLTITGLAGLTSSVASLEGPGYLTLGNAASSANNGTFQIVEYISPTSCVIASPTGVASDANSGSITWSVSSFPGLQPLPVYDAPGAVWPDTTANVNGNLAWGVMMSGAANTANCAGYIASMQTIVATWKSPTWYEKIVLNFSVATTWNEFTPWSSTHNPSGGAWGSWGANVSGVWTETRLTGAQFGTYNEYCLGTIPYGNTPVSYVS
jgi:hypothetical protein